MDLRLDALRVTFWNEYPGYPFTDPEGMDRTAESAGGYVLSSSAAWMFSNP